MKLTKLSNINRKIKISLKSKPKIVLNTSIYKERRDREMQEALSKIRKHLAAPVSQQRAPRLAESLNSIWFCLLLTLLLHSEVANSHWVAQTASKNRRRGLYWRVRWTMDPEHPRRLKSREALGVKRLMFKIRPDYSWKGQLYSDIRIQQRTVELKAKSCKLIGKEVSVNSIKAPRIWEMWSHLLCHESMTASPKTKENCKNTFKRAKRKLLRSSKSLLIQLSIMWAVLQAQQIHSMTGHRIISRKQTKKSKRRSKKRLRWTKWIQSGTGLHQKILWIYRNTKIDSRLPITMSFNRIALSSN